MRGPAPELRWLESIISEKRAPEHRFKSKARIYVDSVREQKPSLKQFDRQQAGIVTWWQHFT